MNTGKGEVSRDPPLSAEYCVFSAAMDEGLFAVKMSGPLSLLIQPADIWLQVAYGHPRRSSCTGERLEETTPVAFSVKDAAHIITTGAVEVETSALKLDARTVLAVGNEAKLDFRLQTSVMLPVGGDLPVKHQARVRFPQCNTAPVTSASVVTTLVPAPPDPWLDHRVHRVGLPDLVDCQRPPSAHLLGEHSPCHRRRRLNAHDLGRRENQNPRTIWVLEHRLLTHTIPSCSVRSMTSQPGCSSLNLASFSAFMQTMVFMQKCEWSLAFSRNNYAVCVTGLSCNGLGRARQLRESRYGLTSIVRGLRGDLRPLFAAHRECPEHHDNDRDLNCRRIGRGRSVFQVV